MAVKLKLKDTRDKKHRRLTRRDVHRAAKRYKNGGRWGKDDEIGTLNFTTAADIVGAARLVTHIDAATIAALTSRSTSTSFPRG